VSPFPVQMEDHWRPEPGEDQDRARLMWFIRVGDYPAVAAMAEVAWTRLAGLHGLDLVPREWLHVTTLITGFADEITGDQVEDMTNHARRVLTGLVRPRIMLGRVLYHPRAVMLDAGPAGTLEPVLRAVQDATVAATGREGTLHRAPWMPHVTLAYGSAMRPAGPVIDALGKSVPGGEVAISAISLVSQKPKQMFKWDLIATVPVGVGAPGVSVDDRRDGACRG